MSLSQSLYGEKKDVIYLTADATSLADLKAEMVRKKAEAIQNRQKGNYRERIQPHFVYRGISLFLSKCWKLDQYNFFFSWNFVSRHEILQNNFIQKLDSLTTGRRRAVEAAGIRKRQISGPRRTPGWWRECTGRVRPTLWLCPPLFFQDIIKFGLWPSAAARTG